MRAHVLHQDILGSYFVNSHFGVGSIYRSLPVAPDVGVRAMTHGGGLGGEAA